MSNAEVRLVKRVDQTLWARAFSSLGRVFYSSTFNIYSFLVSTKRNAVVKYFKNYVNSNTIAEEKHRELAISKYQKAYDNYISTLNKYITENLYTKLKKETITLEEQRIVSSYYEISDLKNTDQVEYKNKLRMLLLKMDWSIVTATKSDAYIEKYKEFYLYNMEELYKASMRHSSVLLANIKYDDSTAYNAIYSLIDSYIREVLPTFPETKQNNQIIKDYRKYVSAIDNFEHKDFNETRKRIALLSFAGDLFEFSLPMLAKEQCYEELITSSRLLLCNNYIDADKFAAYEVLLDSIEEYIENILVKKNTWFNLSDKERFEKLNEKWQVIKKLARIDYDSFKKQRELLFIDYDKQYMEAHNIQLKEVKDYYRERLIILHALRKIKRHATLTSKIYTKHNKVYKLENDSSEQININKDNIISYSDIVNNHAVDNFIKNVSFTPNYICYRTDIGKIYVPPTISADGVDILKEKTYFDNIDNKEFKMSFRDDNID